jgi:hypothetical protein
MNRKRSRNSSGNPFKSFSSSCASALASQGGVTVCVGHVSHARIFGRLLFEYRICSAHSGYHITGLRDVPLHLGQSEMFPVLAIFAFPSH